MPVAEREQPSEELYPKDMLCDDGTRSPGEDPEVHAQEVNLEELPPEARELAWYRHYYRGDGTPQLTLRAVLMGSVLGGVMALSNLYVGLKTGWGLGVAITACILSFAIWKSLSTLFPRLFPPVYEPGPGGFFDRPQGGQMSILENNCMQSTASSAGYSTGGTMVSAIAAYLMITHHHVPWVTLTLWTFFLAALGVFMAIPMKRQMINIEQLRFPSGVAAAETLKSLHSQGAEAVARARSLGLAGVLGGVLAWLRGVGWPFRIPEMVELPGKFMGFPWIKWTFGFETSLIMIAAGAIIGWKVSWSMLLGACINYGLLAPWMVSLGAIDAEKLGYRAIVSWSTWAGASMMVSSGLLLFALQWRTVLKSLGELGSLFKGRQTSEEDPIQGIEVPARWFAVGVTLAGAGCVAVLVFGFGTALWMGLIAVAMTFFLALVACRATGESDITPIGAMGKITQLTFGFLAPSNMVTNLMTASVTAGAASSSADLLTDLKSGYLLGANPRKQFLAQFLGIFAGTLIVVPAFYVLVPNAEVLGTDKWPAPAAQVWAKVAELLSAGIGALHPTARWGLFIGAMVGCILPLVEMALPKKLKPFVPSPTGLGLAMVIPFFNSLSMFLGAVLALIYTRLKPVLAERFIIPVSSGIIAGESLMGIVVTLLAAAGLLGE
ncbi:MAG TPA: OPT family oligopeptide transporter [Candidatus Nitrosotenuis sp.]|nr:OPT family oligopeptide transporter [Candidatus Nitrosotenuis sp.]